MSQDRYDVVVIGAGPGGYIAALSASDRGKRVALIEKYLSSGGTCLNVGCIPSKALLESSHLYYDVKHHSMELGVLVKDVQYDLEKVLARKDKIVSQLTQGIKGLLKKGR